MRQTVRAGSKRANRSGQRQAVIVIGHKTLAVDDLEDFGDGHGLRGRMTIAHPGQNIARRLIEILHVNAVVAEVRPTKIREIPGIHPAPERGLALQGKTLGARSRPLGRDPGRRAYLFH